MGGRTNQMEIEVGNKIMMKKVGMDKVNKLSLDGFFI